MPAAIAIPAILGAAGIGTSLVGAKLASNASKDAAKLQVAASDKAQAFTERAYQDQQRALSPYMQAGEQSLGSLMARYQGQPLQNRFAPGGGQAAEPFQMPQGGMPKPQGGGMSLGSAMGQPPQGAPMQAQPMQPGAGGGGMVRVKAPTGEMAQFPEGSPGLQKALQLGAQRI